MNMVRWVQRQTETASPGDREENRLEGGCAGGAERSAGRLSGGLPGEGESPVCL